MRTGAKTIETRSWATSYRGPLLICAAKRRRARELESLLRQWRFQAGLGPLIGMGRHPEAGAEDPTDTEGPGNYRVFADDLLFGKAVALVDLVDCRPTVSLGLPEYWREEKLGDYSPGRYAWVTTNCRIFEPFPVTGRQGLFEVEVPDALAYWLGRNILLGVLHGISLRPIQPESELHREVELALAAAGLSYRREVRLGRAGRIDFLVGQDGRTVGVECKVGPLDTAAVTAQLERYAGVDDIDELILVTERAWPGRPAGIGGKPLAVVALRQGDLAV
jgi:hypothetical protein